MRLAPAGVDEVAKAFNAMGFACVLLRHRLGPTFRFPAQAQDVASGFAWTKAHIRQYGGDPSKLFLAGHSSGAHLSLLIACDRRYLAKYGLGAMNITGVLGLSTPTNLAPTSSAMLKLRASPDMGFGDALMAGRGADTFGRDRVLMLDASPVAHASRHLPRTLLIVGDHDYPALPWDAAKFF